MILFKNLTWQKKSVTYRFIAFYVICNDTNSPALLCPSTAWCTFALTFCNRSLFLPSDVLSSSNTCLKRYLCIYLSSHVVKDPGLKIDEEIKIKCTWHLYGWILHIVIMTKFLLKYSLTIILKSPNNYSLYSPYTLLPFLQLEK